MEKERKSKKIQGQEEWKNKRKGPSHEKKKQRNEKENEERKKNLATLFLRFEFNYSINCICWLTVIEQTISIYWKLPTAVASKIQILHSVRFYAKVTASGHFCLMCILHLNQKFKAVTFNSVITLEKEYKQTSCWAQTT